MSPDHEGASQSQRPVPLWVAAGSVGLAQLKARAPLSNSVFNVKATKTLPRPLSRQPLPQASQPLPWLLAALLSKLHGPSRGTSSGTCWPPAWPRSLVCPCCLPPLRCPAPSDPLPCSLGFLPRQAPRNHPEVVTHPGPVWSF